MLWCVGQTLLGMDSYELFPGDGVCDELNVGRVVCSFRRVKIWYNIAEQKKGNQT